MSSRFFCPLLCGMKISDLDSHSKTCVNKELIGKYFLRCPYNPNHIVKSKVYKAHIQSCGDRFKKKKEPNEEVENEEEEYEEEEKENEKNKMKKKNDDKLIIIKPLNSLAT